MSRSFIIFFLFSSFFLLFVASATHSGEAGLESPESPRAMIEAITARTAQIEKREIRIRAEQERLNELRDDVNSKIEKLQEQISALENILKKVRRVDRDNLKGLAKIYENMPPEDAALMLERIEPKLALRLFKAINSRKAGRILGFVESGKALRFSEEYGKSIFDEKSM